MFSWTDCPPGRLSGLFFFDNLSFLCPIVIIFKNFKMHYFGSVAAFFLSFSPLSKTCCEVKVKGSRKRKHSSKVTLVSLVLLNSDMNVFIFYCIFTQFPWLLTIGIGRGQNIFYHLFVLLKLNNINKFCYKFHIWSKYFGFHSFLSFSFILWKEWGKAWMWCFMARAWTSCFREGWCCFSIRMNWMPFGFWLLGFREIVKPYACVL